MSQYGCITRAADGCATAYTNGAYGANMGSVHAESHAIVVQHSKGVIWPDSHLAAGHRAPRAETHHFSGDIAAW